MTRADRDAFTYPEEAPLVDRDTLSQLIQFLDSDAVLLLLADQIDDSFAGVVTVLSEATPELSELSIRAVGLYTGPPADWQPHVLPMLREVRAGIVFAVADPEDRLRIEAFLTTLEPGIYLIDRGHEIRGRYDSEEKDVAELLARAADGPVALFSERPASVPSYYAEVRVVDVATKAVLCTATAEGVEIDQVAERIAESLRRQRVPFGKLAVFPLRQGVDDRDASTFPGVLIASLIADELERAEPDSVFPPRHATMALDLNEMTLSEYESNPARLTEHVKWQSFLVGRLEVKNVPKPSPATGDPDRSASPESPE